MSRLVVEELITILTQNFTVYTPINIGGIKPYLLSGNPSATSITITLLNGATTLFTKTLTLAQIKTMGSTTKDVWHGFIPFTSDASIYLTEGDYSIVLSATGYTYNSVNFIGWCKDYVCTCGNVIGGDPINYKLYPYSYRLIEYKPREK
jgi:hypothetical protein